MSTTAPAHDPGNEKHEVSSEKIARPVKDRSRFRRLLRCSIATSGVDVQGSTLIVGGGIEDAQILSSLGFSRITLSNIDGIHTERPQLPGTQLTYTRADIENMDGLADGSYDLVLAHEVLHHCRSPHRAVLEMLRVSRRHAIFLEPNDSFVMRLLVRLRLSFPYEVPAVIANGYLEGGVSNSCIPNYIFRWAPRALWQTIASAMPETSFGLHTFQYWDFNVDAAELSRRKQTRIGTITRVLPTGLLLAALHAFQAVSALLPPLDRQGNKFFACITKQDRLQPWLVQKDDAIAFNRDYRR